MGWTHIRCNSWKYIELNSWMNSLCRPSKNQLWIPAQIFGVGYFLPEFYEKIPSIFSKTKAHKINSHRPKAAHIDWMITNIRQRTFSLFLFLFSLFLVFFVPVRSFFKQKTSSVPISKALNCYQPCISEYPSNPILENPLEMIPIENVLFANHAPEIYP